MNSNEWHLDTSIAAGGRSKVLQVVVYILLLIISSCSLHILLFYSLGLFLLIDKWVLHDESLKQTLSNAQDTISLLPDMFHLQRSALFCYSFQMESFP